MWGIDHMAEEHQDGGRVDGRTARRDRNRLAVLDAVIELFCEGNLSPGVHEVARRSGVSLRSVYRYFEDVDELIASAIERQLERSRPHFGLDDLGQGPLHERIDRFAVHRVELYETVRAVFRAASVRAATDERVREAMQHSRRWLAEQSCAMFAPELAQLDDDRRQYVQVSLDLLGQLDTLENLRTICELDVDTTVEYVRHSCERLLHG